jgi:ribonuclease BN (tRNA processing enzyme)
MRIHTLGTSHGDSTFCRFNSCTVYETADGTLYMVDAGAPAEALLRRKRLSLHAVRAVFISHMHDDHAGGLSGIIKQVTKHKQNWTNPLSLYLPEANAAEALRGWVLALHEPADDPIIDYRVVDDGIIYEDDNLTVTAIRTDHLRTHGRTIGDPCSFAYILHFRKENITVLHTGDLRADLADYPTIAFEQDFDVCVAEATHYNPAQGAQLFGRSRFGRLIFIHIHDPWHIHVAEDGQIDNGEERLLDYYRNLPCPVSIAHDGESFDI